MSKVTKPFIFCYLFSVVEFSCDFEGGMCGMSQDNGDVFDWTRHKGRTSSMNTGPANDHTMGTTDGNFS